MQKVCMCFFCHLYSTYDVKITPVMSVILAAYKISINPFTAVLAMPSVWKQPIEEPKLKSFWAFSPLPEHLKEIVSKSTVLKVDLL